jgi:hypothetical protein
MLGGTLESRRIGQVLAAGTAASVATPASPDQSAVVAEATSADYARDPTRWGSPEVAALVPSGFMPRVSTLPPMIGRIELHL